MNNVFRNKKSGNLYRIIGEATDVTDNRMQKVYIYCPLDALTAMYVRTVEEFEQKFENVPV